MSLIIDLNFNKTTILKTTSDFRIIKTIFFESLPQKIWYDIHRILLDFPITWRTVRQKTIFIARYPVCHEVPRSVDRVCFLKFLAVLEDPSSKIHCLAPCFFFAFLKNGNPGIIFAKAHNCYVVEASVIGAFRLTFLDFIPYAIKIRPTFSLTFNTVSIKY